MKISILSVFPEIHEQFLKLSLIGRAIEQKRITINLYRFSDFCEPKERIDEPTAGPGAGMIIKPTVIEAAITRCQQEHGTGVKVFFSPQGTRLTQRVLKDMAAKIISAPIAPLDTPVSALSGSLGHSGRSDHLILVCPRYEGMDERVQKHFADYIISIGDYVVMGGDLPAQVFLEGFLRLIPGIVGRQESVEKESFSGPFLDHPEYGLPVEWHGMRIPDMVQSGNHAAIETWRTQEACTKTIQHRFDWLRAYPLTPEAKTLTQRAIPPHYVALMHTQVKIKDGTIGTTSITSIDLHDTARSCATYGIKNFFMVNPLIDQQAIIKTFLDFWQSSEGKNYNPSRYRAVSKVIACLGLSEVIQKITDLEGQPPLIITTSAKEQTAQQKIDYTCQGTVWAHNRPVLLLFGTGQGLADEIIEQSDYLLTPINGLTDYNHLSVRSAMAIVLDRWLGLQETII